jgi:superfamily II DNA or RNA helicase/HKD family nuclease/predicted house-cleaning noncanonical NTP pyrophosphatase (MazG superfamily)
MSGDGKTPLFYCNKLVRDKIPTIIREEGHTPYYRIVQDQELNKMLRFKFLEEAYELFQEMSTGNEQGIVKEAADVLETLTALLTQLGMNLDDLLRAMKDRRAERGGFDRGVVLESIDMENQQPLTPDFPDFVFTDNDSHHLLQLIKDELERSNKAWFATAFYSPGIVNILTSELTNFIRQGGEISVILSTMGNATSPAHMLHLRDYVPGLKLRVFHPPETPFDSDPKTNLHAKAYLFQHRTGKKSIIIGSSNLTTPGFFSNIEWNYYSPGEVNLSFGRADTTLWSMVQKKYTTMWEEQCVDLNQDFLEGYTLRYHETSLSALNQTTAAHGYGGAPQFLPSGVRELQEEPYGQSYDHSGNITPNVAQVEALAGLEALRNQKTKAAAVIAATGVGKTYLAAFDFKNSNKKKLLFISHRERIIQQAKACFMHVLGGMEDNAYNLVSGSLDSGPSIVFAMIQTLGRNNNLHRYHPREFDYIVVDEFHHAMAPSYQTVIDYFQPEFMLGLTATPERMDGKDVLRLCDYNIAYELRLLDAIDRGLLVPFHYYAIYDATDYQQITWQKMDYDAEALAAALMNDTRTAIVANNLKKFLPYDGKIKAIAFCSSIAHAQYTALRLTEEHGITSIALAASSSEDERITAISRIEDETDPLNVICSIDIFNEGVDIPRLSHVILLRPTQSFTVFLQQLGRGLRKAKGKDYLVVIDFVGNFKNVHIAPLALSGYTSVKEFVEETQVNHGRQRLLDTVPTGCVVSPEVEVRRVWTSTFKKIFDGMSLEDRLRALYFDIKRDVAPDTPTLMDFIANPQFDDPMPFIKYFGSWIKTKKAFGDLAYYEEKVFGTPMERFLEYLENDLNPVKSYKMVVLNTLLNLRGISWPFEEIAQGFYQYYLNHPERIVDYDELSKQDHPENYPLSKVVHKIVTMPLNFLSNKSNDWFILDKKGGVFSLKSEIAPHWMDDSFRLLNRDRVDYALAKYFHKKSSQTSVVYQPSIIEEKCFKLDSMFVKTVARDSLPVPGHDQELVVDLDGNPYKALLRRLPNKKAYVVDYSQNSELVAAIEQHFTGAQKGSRVFTAKPIPGKGIVLIN